MTSRPPRFARRILAALAPPEDAPWLLADADEEYATLCADRGPRTAVRWYWRQVAGSVLPLLAQRIRNRGRRGSTTGEPVSLRTRSGLVIDGARNDVRFAFRQMRRSPVFAATVILTLALGIGANAAMFGVIDRLLLRPPAYLTDAAHTHRVYVAESWNGREYVMGNMSYRRYLELADSIGVPGAAFFDSDPAVGIGDESRQLRVSMVSAGFWGFFSAEPALGRFFTPEEDRVPNGTPVAVLGHRYWMTRYGSRSDVLGQTIMIGRQPYTIIGVTPPGFTGTLLTAPVAFVPITAAAADVYPGSGNRYYTTHGNRWVAMMVRRAAGVDVADFERRISTAYYRSREVEIAENDRGTRLSEARPRAIVASVLPERGPNQGTDSKVATWLSGMAAIVFLVACANVANLFLVRALVRRREIALRLAVGVGRGRLLRQLATESLVFAFLAAVGGAAIVHWGGRVLRAAFLPEVDWGGSPVDLRLLAFIGAAALVAELLTGLAPALYSVRFDAFAALRTGTRGGSRHRSLLRSSLLVFQAALCLVLLTGAGLFIRSLHNVNGVPLGYDADHVAHVSIERRGVRMPAVERRTLAANLTARARALPGVVEATEAVSVPFYMDVSQTIFVDGVDSTQRLGNFIMFAGAPSHFTVMGTRIVRGRAFAESDREGAQPVMVVSESMARTLWHQADPLGRCVRITADTEPCTTVIGVAEDIKRESLSEEPGLQYYLPISQFPGIAEGVLVRTRGDAAREVETVRRELQRLMPGTSFVSVTPLRNMLDPNYRPWRLGATMFTIFGALALVIAAVGLYSVIAYNVAQRSHEIGVRVALGARRGDIVRSVLGEGLWISLAGTVIGLSVVLWAGKFIADVLFNVSPRDPVTLAAVALTLFLVAVAATAWPARKAAGVDPTVALRAE